SGASAIRLTKLGSGTFTLSGNNTYPGVTVISGGTLQIGDGGTAGAVAGNIVNNANLIFNRSDGTTYTGSISGSGGVTKLGAGTLTLSGGVHTYGGATTVNEGQLSFTAGALPATTALTI